MHAIGGKVQDQPDKTYGQWVSQFYKSVASTGQPRYDYVTASIQRPPGTFATHYERLLLPWKTPSNEVLVTLSSRGLATDAVDKPSVIEPENSVARYSAMSS